MNSNWYDNSDWYSPLESVCEPAPAPGGAAPKAAKKKKHRGLYLGICLLLLLGATVFAIFHQGNSQGSKIIIDGTDIADDMPENWKDFFEDYFTEETTGKPAEINIPEVEDRGSLSLRLAGSVMGSSMSLQQLYKSSTPSVVYVKAMIDGKNGYFWGSGVILSEDGYILTNTHIIDKCDSAEVGLTNGESYPAKLVGADSISDLAILKIDASGLTPAVFLETERVQVGDPVVAIGNPIGEAYRLTMTYGIISAKDRSVSYNGADMNLLQTDTAINEGNSGGPLLNDRGQVVGIVNMKLVSAYSGIEGIGFAIPTDTVVSIVSALMKDGQVSGRSLIGITVGAVPEEAMTHYDLPEGLYISEVAKGSDAEKQGVQVGDILLEINGIHVKTTTDVSDIKSELKIGDTMHFVIWRNGKTVELDVLLIDANDVYNK